MNYKIISSSSKGNCVIVENIMFDCGVPFAAIKNELYDIKYLIITHVHSDHLKPQTLEQIVSKFPTIQIIGNYEVHNAFNVNHIANAGFPVVTEDYAFYPFECEHDVLTYGYTFTIDDIDIIYCTDTGTMKNAPMKKYDYFFIESNHDEEKLEAAKNQKKGRYDPYLSGKRHLSTQKAKAFYYTFRKSPKAKFIELHKSNRFY